MSSVSPAATLNVVSPYPLGLDEILEKGVPLSLPAGRMELLAVSGLRFGRPQSSCTVAKELFTSLG
jgi:hypothetical protein